MAESKFCAPLAWMINLGNNPVCGIDDCCVGVGESDAGLWDGCGGNVISIDYFLPLIKPRPPQIIKLLQIYEAASPPRFYCNLINVTAEVHKYKTEESRRGENLESSSDFGDKIVTVRNVSRAAWRDPWHGVSPGVTMSRVSRDTSHTS